MSYELELSSKTIHHLELYGIVGLQKLQIIQPKFNDMMRTDAVMTILVQLVILVLIFFELIIYITIFDISLTKIKKYKDDVLAIQSIILVFGIITIIWFFAQFYNSTFNAICTLFNPNFYAIHKIITETIKLN
jgi:fatty acid desaturase